MCKDNNTKSFNLIGITGKINSGKDECGLILQYLTSIYYNNCSYDEYKMLNYNTQSEWKIVKFADKIKDIVCVVLSI